MGAGEAHARGAGVREASHLAVRGDLASLWIQADASIRPGVAVGVSEGGLDAGQSASRRRVRVVVLAVAAARELKQFHFHSPAEHLVAGARYPLEIHFVHEDRSGGLTVLAVFVKEGRTNPALKLIADALRKGRARTGPPPRLKLKTLIASVDGYFAYSGSLTTPPCTQPVSWIVLAEPLEADAATLRRFSEVLGGNARPVQPLDGRVVLKSRR